MSRPFPCGSQKGRRMLSRAGMAMLSLRAGLMRTSLKPPLRLWPPAAARPGASAGAAASALPSRFAAPSLASVESPRRLPLLEGQRALRTRRLALALRGHGHEATVRRAVRRHARSRRDGLPPRPRPASAMAWLRARRRSQQLGPLLSQQYRRARLRAVDAETGALLAKRCGPFLASGRSHDADVFKLLHSDTARWTRPRLLADGGAHDFGASAGVKFPCRRRWSLLGLKERLLRPWRRRHASPAGRPTSEPGRLHFCAQAQPITWDDPALMSLARKNQMSLTCQDVMLTVTPTLATRLEYKGNVSRRDHSGCLGIHSSSRSP